jgi:hypothetical protein
MIDPIDLMKIDPLDRLFGRDKLKDEINELREKINQYENAVMWADHYFEEREDYPGTYYLKARNR